ncbi:hypothetical protein QAD02_021699 [Eretmocerus hayati]|uniref:Uncharacterized protein n=1 Tax=Eretmocerus hayati TaxID=131215 RepID=A0ACC2PSG7_9HYME|nr:hypothetical protein QAD02_021699 [Eretmocerus hayati]
MNILTTRRTEIRSNKEYNRDRRRCLRTDSKCHSLFKKQNASRMRIRRKHEKRYKLKDKVRDSAGKRKMRANETIRHASNAIENAILMNKLNIGRINILRQDEIFKIRENDPRKNQKRYECLHELLSYRENYMEWINHHSRDQEDKKYKGSILIEKFLDDRTGGPDHVFPCCFNLFFRKSMYPHYNNEKINERSDDVHFKNFLTGLECGKSEIEVDIDGSNMRGDENEEVLILERNKGMVDEILVIAPGQDKTPIPSQRLENFQDNVSQELMKVTHLIKMGY